MITDSQGRSQSRRVQVLASASRHAQEPDQSRGAAFGVAFGNLGLGAALISGFGVTPGIVLVTLFSPGARDESDV